MLALVKIKILKTMQDWMPNQVKAATNLIVIYTRIRIIAKHVWTQKTIVPSANHLQQLILPNIMLSFNLYHLFIAPLTVLNNHYAQNPLTIKCFLIFQVNSTPRLAMLIHETMSTMITMCSLNFIAQEMLFLWRMTIFCAFLTKH